MNKVILKKALYVFLFSTWTIVAFLLGSTLIGLLIGILADTAILNWLITPVGELTLAALVYVAGTAFLLLPLGLRRVRGSELKEWLGLQWRSVRKMVSWAFLTWGIYFLSYAVIVILLLLVQLPGVDLQQKQEVGFTNPHGFIEFAAAFVTLVIIAPIFEELMFRGFLFGRLRTVSNFWVSAIITSLIFAVLHLQLNVGIDVFVLSLFLCFLREKFQSIWPGVMVHMLKNGLAYTLLFILPLYGVKLV